MAGICEVDISQSGEEDGEGEVEGDEYDDIVENGIHNRDQARRISRVIL